MSIYEGLSNKEFERLVARRDLFDTWVIRVAVCLAIVSLVVVCKL